MNTNMPLVHINRRGAATQRDGKNFEALFACVFNHRRILSLNASEKSFVAKLLSAKNIDIDLVRSVDVKMVAGDSKNDLLFSVMYYDHHKDDVHFYCQTKGIPSATQFFQGNVHTITDIFSHKYPLAAVGMEKMVGAGEYSYAAKRLGYGGSMNKNGKMVACRNRFLIAQLEQVEREEIKGVSEDSGMYQELIESVLMGDNNEKPEFCIFPSTPYSTNPDDWCFFKYDDAISMMMKVPTYENCDIYLGEKQVHPKKEVKSFNFNYFNFKMKDAGHDDIMAHQLQIMASPMAIYQDLQNFKR